MENSKLQLQWLDTLKIKLTLILTIERMVELINGFISLEDIVLTHTPIFGGDVQKNTPYMPTKILWLLFINMWKQLGSRMDQLCKMY